MAPAAALYLTVQIDVIRIQPQNAKVLEMAKDVTAYLLDEAKVAMVPFYAFGASPNSSWYRLSVGTCKLEDIDEIMESIRLALNKLS